MSDERAAKADERVARWNANIAAMRQAEQRTAHRQGAEEWLELARHHLDAEHAGERMAEAVKAVLAWLPGHEGGYYEDAPVMDGLRAGLAAWEAHQWPPDTKEGP